MRVEWKPIEGYEGRYEISNTGEVKSTVGKIERILKPCPSPEYLAIRPAINLKQKNIYIHRLVATHFLPNPKKYTQVNHINGNKHDNSVGNLEWCTPMQNNHHAMAMRGTPHKRIKNGINGETYESSKEAALKIGVTYRGLRYMLVGKIPNRLKLEAI